MGRPVVAIDFESRSTVDLRKTGVYPYAEHETTDIWCMSWSIDGGEPKLWESNIRVPGVAADPFPTQLLDAINRGAEMRAHNAQFERVMWHAIGVKRYGFPVVPLEMWHCTAAEAAAMALPRSLEQCAEVLKVGQQKDMAGHRLMMQMCRPRSRKGGKIVWWDDPEKVRRLGEYCKDDVRTEQAVYHAVRRLDPSERQVYLLDQTINDRGILLDIPLIHAAKAVAQEALDRANKEVTEATDGAVTAVTQTGKLAGWLGVDSVRKSAVQEMLEGDLPSPARRALEARAEAGRSSLSKLDKMLEVQCVDQRVRGLLLYHGASTGRWCLSADHEVLTPNGWVPIAGWKGGYIAVWSPDEMVSFQKADKVSFPYEGPMVHHLNKRMDQLSTPDHTMPSWNIRTGEFTPRRADAIGRCQVPYTGVVGSRLAPCADELRVLVMVQADGHFTSSGALSFHFKKRRKTERAKRLLRRAQIPFLIREYETGTVLEVPRRYLPLYVRQFQDKTFGWWLLNCDAAVVFDELEYWDAYRSGPNSVQYSSTSKQNVDALQALAHISGRAASVSVRSKNPAWNPCWTLSVWLTPSNRHELRKPGLTVPFRGQVYCASTSTGFFLVRRNGKVWVTGNTGRLIQPQNMPRGEVKAVHRFIPAVLARDYELLSLVGSPPSIVSALLRGCLRASPGCRFVSGDFSQIEARIVNWLAGQWDVVAEFAKPKNRVYEKMAAKIYSVSVDDITKDDPRRQLGKAVELACGFQMGADTFRTQAKEVYGVTLPPIVYDEEGEVVEDFAADVVQMYRETHARVKQLWRDLNDAALRATAQPGKVFEVRNCRFSRRGGYLWLVLPSGRPLAYASPEIKEVPVPWDETGVETRPAVRVWGVNSMTRKWTRRALYGGLLTENIVQALARDVMVGGMLRLEAAGYPNVLSVHDEILCDVPDGHGNEEEFQSIMTQVPAWAKGLPVAGEVWSGERYRK